MAAVLDGRLKIDLVALGKALGVFVAACGKATTPKSKLVRMETRFGAWSLSVCDRRTSLHYQSQCPTQQDAPEWECLIDPDTLRQIADRTKNAQAEITYNPAKRALVVEMDRGKYSVQAFPAESGGEPPEVTGPSAIIKGAELRVSLKRCRPAVDPVATRMALSGVHVSMSGETLTFAATDDRRVHTQGAAAISVENAEFKGVIPESAVVIAEKLLDMNPDGPTEITMSDRAVQIDSGDWCLVSTLVDGRFPDCKMVFLKEHRRVDSIPIAELARMMRQAAITTGVESRGVDLLLGSGIISVSSQAPEIGECRVKMECPTDPSSPEIVITVNPSYVREVLGVLPSEEYVELRSFDESSVLEFRSGAFSAAISPISRRG